MQTRTKEASAANARALFDADSRFAELYNRESFLFSHALGRTGLFELPSLIELARRRPCTAQYAYWSRGSVNVRDRWETNEARSRSLDEAIGGIAQNDSLVMLKRVEQDAVLGPVLKQLFSEIMGAVGSKMSEDVIIGRGTILIASPHRITAYHLDADVNFLFQVKGDKQFNVFDQTNRAVISEEELERYFCGDPNGAQFNETRQAAARAYSLGAGMGVHIPSTAPHWARNSADVSVALSVNFDLKSIMRLGQVYRMNAKLRRLGMRPTAPGYGVWRDEVKRFTLASLSRLRGREDTQ